MSLATRVAQEINSVRDEALHSFNQEIEPTSSKVGDTWYKPSVNIIFQRVDDNGNEIWLDISTAGAGVSQDYVDSEVSTLQGNITTLESAVDSNAITANTAVGTASNALAPYSGYMQVSNKLDNFVFQESTSFLNKVADKNRYVKFGDKVVDTYGPELGNFTQGNSTISQINSTLEFTTTATNGTAKALIETNGEGHHYIVKYKVESSSSTIRRYWDGGYNILNIGETYEEILKSDGNTSIEFLLLDSAGASAKLSGVSVREIQTAQFQVPEVQEIITDGSNTTSVAVNAGDYVVDGSELKNVEITDGNTTFTLDGDTITGIGTQTYKSVKIGTGVIGESYIISYTVNSYTSGALIGWDGGWLHQFEEGVGTHTTVVKLDFTTNITIGTTSPSFIGSVTINSVKRVSDTFRAKQDAPIGTALTNTDYFEDRTQIGVTNQQLSYHAYNTVTNAYEGIKTETLFSDVSKEDLLDNSAWMSANGFSKVSQFLYSKGSYLVAPIGIWQSLNKGAYHPVFNGVGCSDFVADTLAGSNPRQWHRDDCTLDTSTANAFKYAYSNFNTTGTSYYSYEGRIEGNTSPSTAPRNPQGKYYDICYPDQFIDVREYSKILTPYEVDLIRDDKEDNGVEEAVSMEYTTQLYNTSASQTPVLVPEDITHLEIGDTLAFQQTDNTWEVRTISTKPYNIEGAGYRTDVSVAYTRVLGQNILYTKTKSILSSNTKLSIDLIGSPSNYPQIMKDRLASGKGLIGINPLLVGQDGTSYASGGTYKPIFSDKVISFTNFALSSATQGESWALSSVDDSAYTSLIDNTGREYAWGSNIMLVPYTSKNQPYIQATPKPVIDIEPKTIASNSHSIYKGALIGNQVAGKIQVGNGTNGYESKVLENAEIPKAHFNKSDGISWSGINGAWRGTIIFLDVLGNETDAPNGIGYYVYQGSYVGTVTNITTTKLTLTQANDWFYIGATPQHSTIALDNADSPASKWFNTLSQGDNGVVGSVYGEELAYNSVTSSYDGDDDEFEQLTNGTVTDLNGNTTRTFVGHLPINGEVK